MFTDNVPGRWTLTHRNIVYTPIPTSQEAETLAKLQEMSHSDTRLIQEEYQLTEGISTASGKNTVTGILRHLPESTLSQPKFKAIVIDCEMGMTAAGHNELTHLTVIELFSGKTLVNQLVNPSTPITDWKTTVTGIDSRKMNEAVRQNKALSGWETARAALWAIADRDTIIIGQSVLFDLFVLRTVHNKIVDSCIIAADAVLKEKALRMNRRWSLQTLCQELLGIQIRQSLGSAETGTHDSLEDALATRELVFCFAKYPERLIKWSKNARKEMYKPTSNRAKAGWKGKKPKAHLKQYRSTDGTSSSDGESCERWEDVVDWELWPKSPPSD
jgi:DNA polymerase III epsilon subunit-like protein